MLDVLFSRSKAPQTSLGMPLNEKLLLLFRGSDLVFPIQNKVLIAPHFTFRERRMSLELKKRIKMRGRIKKSGRQG